MHTILNIFYLVKNKHLYITFKRKKCIAIDEQEFHTDKPYSLRATTKYLVCSLYLLFHDDKNKIYIFINL